jgi:hypothetical protein
MPSEGHAFTSYRLAARVGRPVRRSDEGRRKGGTIVHISTEGGRLAARTLHDALPACGLDPARQVYLNLFADPGEAEAARVIRPDILAELRGIAALGAPIVGLGRLVQRALVRAEIAHRPLVHPAARGSIRRRAAYQAHVATVLQVPPVNEPVIVPARPNGRSSGA